MEKVTVAATINAPVEKVWEYWNTPAHISGWCFASPEWHAPRAENDLTVGGKFLTRMEARDGSIGFDFWGIYDIVETHTHIAYTLGDNRQVTIEFISHGDHTEVIETFDAEDQNPVEMQQMGWQAILNNFKNYTENN
jgi:uncharacterized protein YndB with AHSA1/START domain